MSSSFAFVVVDPIFILVALAFLVGVLLVAFRLRSRGR